MSYNQLRTLSFRIPEGQTIEPRTFQTLNFPEPWKTELRELQTEITGYPNVPITSLNKALRALVPDLIYIAPKAAKPGRQPWLYSANLIDTKPLHIIVQSWVKTQFSKASEKRLSAVIKKLPLENLQWEEPAPIVDVGKWTTASNGTAELGGSNSFIMLPHMIAEKLSKSGVSLQFGSESLRFRRAPLNIGSQGAELVSWPPLEYVNKLGQWYWSVVITLTLQTVPFQSFPVLHCEFGVRRWVSLPNSYIPGGETSVYLLTQVPWIQGLTSSNSFQVAPIRWKKIAESKKQENAANWRLIWGSSLAPLLDRLNPKNKFPDPQAIAADPVSAFNLKDTPSAAIVYRNGIKPDRGVGSGLGPADRRLLVEQIESLLSPEWTFVEAPERVKFSITSAPKPPEIPQSKKLTESHVETLKRTQIALSEAITKEVGDLLTLEIWYQRESTRDTLIEAVRYCLGIPESASFPYKFPNLDFTLDIQVQILGALGDELQVDSSIKEETERRQKAIFKRGEEVEKKLTQSSREVLAFIELGNKDDFTPETDPKAALKRGFALARRLTQFISTDNTKLSHSAINGFLDLLRQLGVQIAPPKIVIKDHSLPEKLNYVGVWLIKQNSPTSADGSIQRVPVMVYMTSDKTEIKAIAPGFKEWLPYKEALLAIAQGNVELKGQAISFIDQTLRNQILPLGDTLLLCHAQNLRSVWSWLKNGEISTEKVTFGKARPFEIKHLKGLRIVRLRDGQNHETPEWYAQEGEKHGFTKGIFQMGQRIFASTYNKSKQLKKLSVNLSKASSPNSYYGNPGLVELTVACIQPGDEDKISPWAMLTHELRHIALQYDEPLKLPLPLHLAKKMEEYVLLIEDGDSTTELQEDELTS